jgi:calnexin
MIFATTELAHHAISTKFPTPLNLRNQTLIVQFEVRHTNRWECAGAYIKLFTDPALDPMTLSNETEYAILFGPDKCSDTGNILFIFKHPDLRTGEWEAKKMNFPTDPVAEFYQVKQEKINHLYTLIMRPDQSYEILVDNEPSRNGTLFHDFTPSVNPPQTFDDPTDEKPLDWAEEEFIRDPTATKPADWDLGGPEYIVDPEKRDPPPGWLLREPRFIRDPNSKPPDDWNEDMHGEWEAPPVANPACKVAPGCGEYEPPMIENPNWKGEWRPPLIKNPRWRGPWRPRQLPNVDWYEDRDPYSRLPPVTGVGFEIWVVTKDIGFANVYIGNDEAALKEWNEQHFAPKHLKQAFEYKFVESAENAQMTGHGIVSHSPDPRPPVRREGEGVSGALADFALNFGDAWTALYEENPAATMLISAIVVLAPVLLFVCCALWHNDGDREEEGELRRRKRRRRVKPEKEAPADAQNEDGVVHRTPKMKQTEG